MSAQRSASKHDVCQNGSQNNKNQGGRRRYDAEIQIQGLIKVMVEIKINLLK